MGSWGLLLHCLTAALYAGLVQDELIKKLGRKMTYLFGMICFTISLLGTVSSSNLWSVNIFSALSGLGSAAITTVPYALITEYYSKKEVYYNNCKTRGVGEDMAVLDSAVYLAQIIPSFFLGYIVELTQTSSAYMFVAAGCGVTRCYLVQWQASLSIFTSKFKYKDYSLTLLCQANTESSVEHASYIYIRNLSPDGARAAPAGVDRAALMNRGSVVPAMNKPAATPCNKDSLVIYSSIRPRILHPASSSILSRSPSKEAQDEELSDWPTTDQSQLDILKSG
ncbi:hypothetical protein JTE90_010078 [Oedothorax gibbosus]|uniref:Uncharacterized protein n=1 Tax=Oedothorax gibbosus TaxID=931172 RepID=A0AAV6UZS0_9ARAC|nr:hypothetical protein JTE90_010078 [Oedothorax gibbosus]